MNPATSGVSMSLADQQQWCPTSVQVTVLQARGLRTKGKSGTNDAYALMQVGKEKFQTSVVEKCVAPVWKEEAAFDLPAGGGGGGGGGGGTERCVLHVHVLHRALVGPDKLLGQAVINLLQLSEDATRKKTEWFKLLDKTGKADKDRGEVLVDIQFMRNNMTASMFDLSAAGKSKSRLGKFKDKVRGKKKESDTTSNVVPSLTQVLTDSEGEEHGDGEVAEGKDEKKKKHKMKSLFSPKSNLQKNMSQSMSVLPAKNSSLSGSQSSGLNVDSSEGKKKFKFKIHKRSGSSGNKDSPSGHPKQGTVEQSNLCINGSHVYCEEPPPRTSRIGSNFSIASSGHGSMEDVPESSPPSVDSLRGMRQYSPWTEEEEENIKEDAGELRGEEEKAIMMEEERRRKEEEEERARRQEAELERLAEEKRRQEEQEEKVRKEEEEQIRREEEERALEEKRREEERERVRIEELERERLAEEKKRQVEQERRRIEEEERAQEERRRQEEEERLREEKKRLEEQERRRIEEEERAQEERRRQEEEERLREEKKRLEEEERAQEERRRQEEEERLRREEEEHERLREERRKLEEQEKRRIEEVKRQREEEERAQEERRRQEEEERLRQEKKRLEEQERRRIEEEKRQIEEEERAQDERRRQEEEERLRREEEQRERLEEEKKRLEEQERRIEERIRKEEEERAEKEQRRRRHEEEEMVRRLELKRRLEEQEKRQREEEERIRMEEERAQEERRKQEEEEFKLAEEKRRQEEEKRRKEDEERAEEEKRRREEEEMMRRQEEECEEKRRLEEQERRREEEERIKEEEERARREKEEFERLVEEKRKQEEEKKRIEAEEKIRRDEEESARLEEERRRKEEEERERLAEEEKRKLQQEKSRIEEEEKRQREEEGERIRKEEERRQEEEERARKEKEEHERLVEEKKIQEEQEKKKIEEEERIRREKEAEKEKREEEARKLEKEKLAKDAEEQKKKENKTKTKPKAPERKPHVAERSPAGVTSTNPFDEDFSDPSEEISDPPDGPEGSTAKVSTAQQRIQCAASSVRSNPVSTDEKDPISTQREKRPAPRPPGSNQAEKQSQREQDASTRHLAQINKQSKDKDVKTMSVLPRRLVQMITPLSRSPTDAKNTQSLTQSSTTRGASNAAKHNKRPAPSRPRSAEEEPPSEHKTAMSSDGNISSKCASEAKQPPIVYGLNPFEDDEDENAAQDDTTSSGNTASVQWPPAVSQAADKDAASHAKIKSSKTRAPPAPAQKSTTGSTSAEQNTDHVTEDKGVTEPDNSSHDPETVNPVPDQEASPQESQPAMVQSAVEEAGGKKEGPPVASRRLQPVKPLNPLEQRSVPVIQGEKENKSTEILCEVQEKTKVNGTELKGPFCQLTQEELISLVVKQETQLADRDKKISELEQYIDNLLVRVMEENPTILMSLNAMK